MTALVPLKWSAAIIAGQSPRSVEVSDLLGSGLPFLQGNAEFGAKHPTPSLQCETAPKRARRGDILLSVRAPVGALNVADQPYGIGRGLCAIRPQGDLTPSFAWWALTSSAPQLNAVSVGSTYEAVTADDVGALRVPVPAKAVQEALAGYLDRETARIDALIAAKRRMVALVEEREKAFLVESFSALGSRTARLGQIAQIFSGAGFPHAYQGRDRGDLPFYKVADLAGSRDGRTICGAANWLDLPEALALGCRPAPPGAILFPKVGAALLKNQRRITTVAAGFDNNLMAVVPEKIDSRFLHHFLTSVDLGELANPGPVPSINEDVVASLRVPIPTSAAQARLADELDAASDRITRAVAKLRQQIDFALEHRAALVTNAVTGQLDIPKAP